MHDDISAGLDRLGGARRHPLPHKWVDDRVQAVTRVLVVEDELAQPSPIDAPVAHVIGPELANDRCESRAAGLVRGMGGFVRVDDGRA